MTTQTELRTLLEDAAYALGLKDACVDDNGEWLFVTHRVTDGEWIGEEIWTPHLDSADGAEMEAELGIDVEWWTDAVKARVTSHFVRAENFSDHDSKQASRRMASLRAAAAIGKANREQEAP